MKKLVTLFLIAVSSPVILQAQSAGGGNCSNLFISEYVEGTGNNKAIEIYNPTNSAIDLSNYQLARYTNGGTTASSVVLSGTVQPHDVMVFVIDKRDPNGTGLEEPIDQALENVGDVFLTPIYSFPTSAMYYNGNDAVALLTSGNAIIDVLGRIGEDPGIGWEDQDNVVWTTNKTLARKSTIELGDNNGFDAFMPEVEWDSLPEGTYSGLGFHQSSCYTAPCTTPSNVSFTGLNTAYAVADNPVTLDGSPSGGTFYGPGMNGNQFDPGAAGLGQHSIVYAYTNGNGCSGAYALCTTVDLSVGGSRTEISSTEGVDVYPIPSAGDFTLKIKDVNGIVSYSVYDNSAKEVMHNSFVANGSATHSISLSEMAAGSYILMLNTPSGNYTEKLIVK